MARDVFRFNKKKLVQPIPRKLQSAFTVTVCWKVWDSLTSAENIKYRNTIWFNSILVYLIKPKTGIIKKERKYLWENSEKWGGGDIMYTV